MDAERATGAAKEAAGATAAFDASARTADRPHGARCGLAPQLWCEATRNEQRSTGTEDCELVGARPEDPGPAQVVDAVTSYVAAPGRSPVPRLRQTTLSTLLSGFSGLARCRSEGSRRRSGGRETRRQASGALWWFLLLLVLRRRKKEEEEDTSPRWHATPACLRQGCWFCTTRRRHARQALAARSSPGLRGEATPVSVCLYWGVSEVVSAVKDLG